MPAGEAEPTPDDQIYTLQIKVSEAIHDTIETRAMETGESAVEFTRQALALRIALLDAMQMSGGGIPVFTCDNPDNGRRVVASFLDYELLKLGLIEVMSPNEQD